MNILNINFKKCQKAISQWLEINEQQDYLEHCKLSLESALNNEKHLEKIGRVPIFSEGVATYSLISFNKRVFEEDKESALADLFNYFKYSEMSRIADVKLTRLHGNIVVGDLNGFYAFLLMCIIFDYEISDEIREYELDVINNLNNDLGVIDLEFAFFVHRCLTGEDLGIKNDFLSRVATGAIVEGDLNSCICYQAHSISNTNELADAIEKLHPNVFYSPVFQDERFMLIPLFSLYLFSKFNMNNFVLFADNNFSNDFLKEFVSLFKDYLSERKSSIKDYLKLLDD